MIYQKKLATGLIALLLMVGVAGCVAEPTAVPDRDVEISTDQAMTAQGKLGDLMMGSVEWTESEFSSLLSVLLEQNGGENSPIDSVVVWFEPNNEIVIRVMLNEGVAPNITTLDVAGTVSVEGNFVVVDIDQAGTGNMSVPSAMLPAISEQINAALADPSLGVAADVETEEGVIRLNVGM